MCIIIFYWLIIIYLFISLFCNTSFLIVNNSCVRDEMSNGVFFLQKKLQQITVQQHLYVEFALAHLNFVTCTSPTDNFTFTYHLPSVSIPIIQPLNCSLICEVANFQRFQRQIDILDNPFQRRRSHF